VKDESKKDVIQTLCNMIEDVLEIILQHVQVVEDEMEKSSLPAAALRLLGYIIHSTQVTNILTGTET
jgi:hypothetical protein